MTMFWWRKKPHMPNYVTGEHFDQSMTDLRVGLDGKFVTKDEFNTRLDDVITILKRLDQERVFTIEWIRRIESDMSLVKNHLKLI